MVEDNQIKAEVSPFAIRKGEIKTFDGQDGYVSMNQIVHKIDSKYLPDITPSAYEILNVYKITIAWMERDWC